MRLFLIFVVSVVLCGCNPFVSNYRVTEKEKLSDKILYKVAVQLNEEKGLVLCGTGGRMMHKIKILSLSFKYHKPIDITGGRELLITSVDALMDAVNNDEKIRPYLNNFPFEPKNIDIEIFLQNRNGSEFSPGNLSILTAKEGLLEYRIYNADTKRFRIIHEETYDEAVERLYCKQARGA